MEESAPADLTAKCDAQRDWLRKTVDRGGIARNDCVRDTWPARRRSCSITKQCVGAARSM